MDKLMKKDQLKRDSLELFGQSYGEPNKQLSVHTLRRMATLNKVFMEYITDMLSTGEIEPEIVRRNIEISHVKVTADFKQLNVFWIDHNQDYVDMDELLRKCAFELRHKLSKLRVIGRVPPIQFVKCRGIHILKEVERKLKQLDLGENYVPRPYPDAIHHTISAANTINHNATTEDENEKRETSEDFSVTIPVMRHDVFGLDHYSIMTQIKTSLNKHKKAIKLPVASSKVNAENISNFLTDEEQKEQFAKFIKQRQKQRRHKLKNLLRESQMYDFAENYTDNEDYDIDGNYYGDDNSDEVDDDDIDEHCVENLNKQR